MDQLTQLLNLHNKAIAEFLTKALEIAIPNIDFDFVRGKECHFDNKKNSMLVKMEFGEKDSPIFVEISISKSFDNPKHILRISYDKVHWRVFTYELVTEE